MVPVRPTSWTCECLLEGGVLQVSHRGVSSEAHVAGSSSPGWSLASVTQVTFAAPSPVLTPRSHLLHKGPRVLKPGARA